jgi:hypothetical protein
MINRFKLLLLSLATLLAACSGPGGTAPPEGTGRLGFAITLPGGVFLDSLSYSITNGANTYTGTENFGDAVQTTFEISGVEDGTGYVISLSAMDSANFGCSGSSTTFAISTDATTSVSVNLICGAEASTLGAVVPDSGSLLVNATVSIDGGQTVCSSLQGLNAPTSLSGGQSWTPIIPSETGSAIPIYTASPAAISAGAVVGAASANGDSAAGPLAGIFLCNSFVGTATITATLPGGPCTAQPEQVATISITCSN